MRILISSRYDALKAGTGESGMPKDRDLQYGLDLDEDGTTKYASPTKRRNKEEEEEERTENLIKDTMV